MKTFTRTFLRPYEDAEWYVPSAAFLAWIQENYIDTGLCTKFREATYSDTNKLVMTLESIWSDDADLSTISQRPEWLDELVLEIEHNTAWQIELLGIDGSAPTCSVDGPGRAPIK
jgi:hypothetical protein